MSNNSSSTSNNLMDYTCSSVTHVFLAISALKVILLLPLSTLVVYVAHQQWRQQHSFKTASHSDIFTYHMLGTELMLVLVFFCYICGIYTNHSVMIMVGLVFSTFAYSGEICFHILTCVERYLAVVHPITYLGLRCARGVRIRNISIGCVWLLSFGLTSVTALLPPDYTTVPLYCFLALSIIIISFCSLSVLCVLIRSGPREAGRGRRWVDQSKQRVFYTITAITCAVWLWFFGLLVSNAITQSPQLSNTVKCVVLMSVSWCNLPSCLVLPLLNLHRAGKLSCCSF